MKKYIALIVAVIVLGGGAFLSQKWLVESVDVTEVGPQTTEVQNLTESRAEAIAPSSQATAPEIRQEKSAQSLQSDSLTFIATAESTVLGAMNVLKAEGRLTFSGREFSGLGFLIEEINEKRSANGYYWILRINGTLSEKGVSQATVVPGDIVEWRYENGY